MQQLKGKLRLSVERQLALDPAEQNAFVRSTLTVASWVFEAVTSRKRHWQLTRQRALPVRTISFGNVTWGGTGKTPCLHHVARLLDAKGCQLMLVSRGYGDDEWKMFASEFPTGLFAIGKHRYENAIACLVPGQNERTVALVDDGLQQWGLKKDMEIVMIDAYNPFGNGHLIPKGRLREYPERALPAADIVVLHHAGHLSIAAQTKLQAAIQTMTRKDVLFAMTKVRLVDLPQAKDVAASMKLRKHSRGIPYHAPESRELIIVGICGIGCPASFESMLRENFPLASVQVHAFPDHHAYVEQDLRSYRQSVAALRQQDANVLVVTTEKDYFRSSDVLEAHLPDLRVALCEMEFLQDSDRALAARIDQLLENPIVR